MSVNLQFLIFMISAPPGLRKRLDHVIECCSDVSCLQVHRLRTEVLAMEHTLQASHAEKLELVQDKLRLAEALCRATDILAGMRPRIISEAGCPCRAETVCSSASGMPAGLRVFCVLKATCPLTAHAVQALTCWNLG